MNDEEFDNFSWTILKVFARAHKGMQNFMNSYFIETDLGELINWPKKRLKNIFKLIDTGRVKRKEDKQFCSVLVKAIGIIGSITARIEEINKKFYLKNEERLLEVDDYIFLLWRERYNRELDTYENLNNFLKN